MRPKNEDGLPLPMPHVRLPAADLTRLRSAGFLALAQDSRSAIWTTKRKIAILDKVIDHVIDGDAVPKWVYAKDPELPDNHALFELWSQAEKAIRAVWREKVAA